jgi:hypothetical protein
MIKQDDIKWQPGSVDIVKGNSKILKVEISTNDSGSLINTENLDLRDYIIRFIIKELKDLESPDSKSLLVSGGSQLIDIGSGVYNRLVIHLKPEDTIILPITKKSPLVLAIGVSNKELGISETLHYKLYVRPNAIVSMY